MGQEHISYINKYDTLSIAYLCDPNKSSLETALAMAEGSPATFEKESELLDQVNEIDLLVIASPNFMHTPQLLRWGQHHITILCEKPAAISEKQVNALKAAQAHLKANIWIAMEYRFMPAINKLVQMLPHIGPIKKVAIRENRYPFLTKIEEWNKDVDKSGDTLVEKCCHFFDLFRLITAKEMASCVSKVHRGLLSDHYGYDVTDDKVIPIIDSAYALLDFEPDAPGKNASQQSVLGCLELCMFAEGSRHQEEIIVTGMRGRLEAYLPENKVFLYQRPTSLWTDKSKPPPQGSFSEEVFDCSDLRQVYDFVDELPSMHAGYHYCSTAIEWKYLIDAIHDAAAGKFVPKVSLDDGIKAVEMGIAGLNNITNADSTSTNVTAHISKSEDNLLNLVLNSAVFDELKLNVQQ
eukprot:scaffold2015_cov125-Skeletonema_dohrnii-CCMP3373.AAC.9